MGKKSLAFFVAASSNIIFAAANIALALDRYMHQEDYEVIIYYDEFLENDEEVFKKIPKCRLMQYKEKEEFIHAMMDRLSESCHFKTPKKLMRFCLFEAFKLLDEYQTIVCLDADISIQDNLIEIVNYGPFGITSDANWTVGDQFLAPVAGFDMDLQGVCSAVIVLQDTLPYNSIYQWCYAAAVEYAPVMKNGDQAIINLMLQQFQITPNLMPLNIWQCMPYKGDALDAKIVHFGTKIKVWNDFNTCTAYPEWYRLYKVWLKMGGSQKNDFCVTPTSALSQINTIRDSFSNIFPFEAIPKGSKIILYGYGNIGQVYTYQIKETNWCHIQYIVDTAFQHEDAVDGCRLCPVNTLTTETNYDYIVIAVNSQSVYQDIYSRLQEMNIDDNKIVCLWKQRYQNNPDAASGRASFFIGRR